MFTIMPRFRNQALLEVVRGGSGKKTQHNGHCQNSDSDSKFVKSPFWGYISATKNSGKPIEYPVGTHHHHHH